MEATQKQPIDPERENLIQQMLRDAQKTDLSSDLTKNPVIHRGDTELPAPMIVNKITSAGYVYCWDTRSFFKAPVLYYMLPQILRQRRVDGSYRWTVTDPKQEPKRGTYKCMLHKDDPNRAHYDDIGFRACPKENITNPYQVSQHMRSKHRVEWAAIEKERIDRERQEDRKLQQLMVESIARKPIEPTQPIAETTRTIIVENVTEKEAKKTTFICDACGADFGSAKTLDNHKKEQHK